MKKESWELLWVYPAFVQAYEFKWEMYVKLEDFKLVVDSINREIENSNELSRKQSKAFDKAMKDYRGLLKDYMKQEEELKNLKEELKKYKKLHKYSNWELLTYSGD